MDWVTVSSKGQIAIPKAIRNALNLTDGSKLTVEVRGQKIVLSQEPGWKHLEGAAAGTSLVADFAAHKKRERDRENTRP